MATVPEEIHRQVSLAKIFLPFAFEQRRKHYANLDGEENPMARFVHYTTAEAALKIIETKRLWMRNTTCMADYREVQHGFDILLGFFCQKDKKAAFVESLEPYYPGVAVEAIGRFDQWWRDIQLNTFITSVSEHDKREDLHGRLSMWRAFGRNNAARVAIVLKVPWSSNVGPELKISLSPVAYSTSDEVHNQLDTVINNIKTNSEFLRSVGRDEVFGAIFHMLRTSVLCLKHEGFHEEREWRAIYSPKMSASPLIESSVEAIDGIPQTIYKVPLDKKLSPSLNDLDLPRLFDRLIIGPSPYPWVMYDAFTTALQEAGIANAGERVFTSNIPIRA